MQKSKHFTDVASLTQLFQGQGDLLISDQVNVHTHTQAKCVCVCVCVQKEEVMCVYKLPQNEGPSSDLIF